MSTTANVVKLIFLLPDATSSYVVAVCVLRGRAQTQRGVLHEYVWIHNGGQVAVVNLHNSELSSSCCLQHMVPVMHER